MWKKFRIAILLFILFLVGADTYMTKYRAVSWDESLWVAIYPINNGNDPEIERYISNLSNLSQPKSTQVPRPLSKPRYAPPCCNTNHFPAAVWIH